MTQYAIPLAGQSEAFKQALPFLLAAPGLEHDTDVSETYVELAAHWPSPGQLVLWDVALSLAGFGKCDLFDVLTRVDSDSRAAVVAAITAAHEAMAA